MAIVSVNEMHGARAGSIDAQWRRTYRRAWIVITDTPLQGALSVRQSVPVSLGNTYRIFNLSGTQLEFDNFAFVTKIDAQVDSSAEDGLHWIVTADYGPWDATQFPENPLNHPIKISFGSNRFEKVVEVDLNGDPVVNSAGASFDPPATRDDSRPTIRIVRNEPRYNPQYARLWKDCLNKDTFFGFDPYTVKMSVPLGELEYSPVCGFYYVVTYEFDVNPDEDGWKKAILDQGLYTDDGSGPEPCKDKEGAAVTSPVLLDGNGGQLGSGGTPVFLQFEIYREANYSALNLDPNSAPGQS